MFLLGLATKNKPTGEDKEKPGAQSRTRFFCYFLQLLREILLSYLGAGHARDITTDITQGIVKDLEHVQPVVGE